MPGRSGGVERLALAISVLWLAATLGALLLFGGAGLTSFAIVMLSNAIVLPLAVIWLFVFARRLTATLAEDNARLRAILSEMHRDLATVRNGGVPEMRDGAGDLRAIEARLSDLAEAQGRAESALARLSPDAPPPAPERQAAPVAEPAVPGPTPEPIAPTPRAEPGEMELPDLIAALQFPADPDDAQGFDALRRALRDRRGAQIVTAAQDVLTLMSQDGIYMDDLDPPPASPDLWRLFAAGEREGRVAALADMGTPDLVDRVSGRLRDDAIFSDAAHHFSRLFEQRFSELSDDMTDAEIAALIRTRSARAFFLLGRASGTFEPE